MARMPTVKLVHRRRGEVRIVNLPEYALDLGRWIGWQVLSIRRGDASNETVRHALREWKINTHRLRDPAEREWRKDHERAYGGRRLELRATRGAADQAAAYETADRRETRWTRAHS